MGTKKKKLAAQPSPPVGEEGAEGEGGASGPTGPTGASPLLTKHELHPAWTAHRSPCGSGMNSCMGSVDALANGCSARPSPARAGRFMGARRGRPRGELKNIGYFIIIN